MPKVNQRRKKTFPPTPVRSGNGYIYFSERQVVSLRNIPTDSANLHYGNN